MAGANIFIKFTPIKAGEQYGEQSQHHSLKPLLDKCFRI